MPFPRSIITLETAYPLALECTVMNNERWIVTSMWREPSPRRSDDNVATFIREVISNSKVAIGPFFDHRIIELRTYLQVAEKELLRTLGRDSRLSVGQQQVMTSQILQAALPEVQLFQISPGPLARGSSIGLVSNATQGPFWADTVLSAVYEPPMS